MSFCTWLAPYRYTIGIIYDVPTFYREFNAGQKDRSSRKRIRLRMRKVLARFSDSLSLFCLNFSYLRGPFSVFNSL